MKITRWGVYDCKHIADRPPQELSRDKRPKRRYVVITNEDLIRHSDRLHCVPIGEKSHLKMFDIELENDEAGCTKPSYIWGFEVYTILKTDFIAKVGDLPKNKANRLEKVIRNALSLNRHDA